MKRPKTRKSYMPPPKEPFSHKYQKESNVHRTNRWTKASLGYRKQNPLCEVSKYYGVTAPAEQTDHIIKVTAGGAEYDPRNFMSITKELHLFKSGKEQHIPILVEWEFNERSEKIPVRREDIFKVFEKKFK